MAIPADPLQSRSSRRTGVAPPHGRMLSALAAALVAAAGAFSSALPAAAAPVSVAGIFHIGFDVILEEMFRCATLP